jgi:hypothetical protein
VDVMLHHQLKYTSDRTFCVSNDAVSNLHYTASNDRMINKMMNHEGRGNKLQIPNVIHLYHPGGTEENSDRRQSGQLKSKPIFEPRPSRTEVIILSGFAILFSSIQRITL